MQQSVIISAQEELGKYKDQPKPAQYGKFRLSTQAEPGETIALTGFSAQAQIPAFAGSPADLPLLVLSRRGNPKLSRSTTTITPAPK